MSCPVTYTKSSIGKKQLMAVSGLLLCGFLVTHLAGNFLILVGPEIFNSYAHALITNPFIYVAEVILLSIFLTHIGLAVKVTMENKEARPTPYFLKVPTGRGATFASSTMTYTGALILLFMIIHLINFKFGAEYKITHDGVEMRDLHRLVMEAFQSPWYVAYYVFSMVVLGFHLSHGFPSAFQTLGFHHQQYTPCLQKLGISFGVLIALGYSLIPLWAYFSGGR